MYDIVETVELLLLLLAETKDHASDVTVFATPLLWLDVARGAYVWDHETDTCLRMGGAK